MTWTSAGSEAVSYEVGWTYDGQCAGISGGSASSGMDTSYTIDGMEEGITYSITVTATNTMGSEVSSAAIGKTSEAGMYVIYISFLCHVLCYSLQFHQVLLLQSVSLVHSLPSLSSGSLWTALKS